MKGPINRPVGQSGQSPDFLRSYSPVTLNMNSPPKEILFLLLSPECKTNHLMSLFNIAMNIH